MNKDPLQIIIKTLLEKEQEESKLNKQLKKLKLDPLILRAQVDVSLLQKQLNKIKLSVNVNTSGFNAKQLNLETSTKSVKSFNAEIQKLIASNRFQKYLNDNSKAIKNYGDAFDTIGQKLSKVSNPDELRSWKDEYRALTTSITATGQEGASVLDKLTKNASKFAQWLLTSGGVMFGIKSLKDVVTNVVELDKSITNLRMATGNNYEQTSKLLDSYTELGKRLGATTVEVANSADAWLRQGKSVEETNKLIEASVILAKVGALDTAESTKYLTSALMGFQLTTEDVLGVVSKLSSVDLVSATSAGGLATGMSYVANNARLAGIEMDKLISYLAVVGETTQKSMENIGTSFNTIFSRMSSIKLGRLADPETEEDLSNVETVLNNLGIKLRDSNSEFRDFGDVLDEVGNKWSTYSSIQQRSLAVAFAGVRNQENFLVLMENYGKTLEYTEVSINSAGFALEKFEAYQQSVEARTKKLTAAFEELSRTMLDSNDVKGFLDLGTNVIETLTTIINKAGLVPTAIGAMSAALSITGKNGGLLTPISSGGIDVKAINLIKEYNNLLSKSEVEQIAFKTSILGTNKSFATYLNGLNGTRASFTGYVSSLARAKLSTLGLTVASTALNIAITMGVSLAIQGLVTWISKLVQEQENARQAAIESSQTYKDEAATLKNYKSQISELREELVKGNLTQEEAANKRSELMKIQDDIINKYSKEAEGIDLVTGSLKEQLNIIDEITRQKAESWQVENYSAIKDAQNYLSKTRSQGASYQAGTESPLDDYIRNQVASLGGKTHDIIATGGGYSAKIGTQIDFKGTYDEIIAFYDKLATRINEYSKEMGIDSNSIVESLLSKMSETISKMKNDPKYNDYKSLVNDDILRTAEAAYTFHYNKLLEARKKYNEAVASGDEKLIAKSYESLQLAKDSALTAVSFDSDYAKELTDLVNQTANVQVNASKDIAIANNDVAASITYTAEQLEEQKKTVDNLYTSLKDLASVMEQTNAGQEYGTAQIIDIISKYPELIGHIEKTADGYKIQKSALENLMKAEIEESKVKARLNTEMAKSNFIANGGSESAINKYSADITSGAITDFSKYNSDIYVTGLSDWMTAKAQEETYNKFLADASNSGFLSGKTKETKTSSKDDPYKDMVESKIDDIKYLTDMGQMTQAQYLKELDTLNQKYYANQDKYVEEFRRINVEVYKGNLQLAEEATKAAEKAAEEAKKQAEEVLKIQQDAIQRRINKATELFQIHQSESVYIEQLQQLLGYISISEEQRLAILEKIADVRKNEYKDTLTDISHENFLLEQRSDTEQKRIDNYRRMQEVVHAEAERLRSIGYDNASNEVEELQNLWYQYENSIKDILKNLNDSITDNLRESLEDQADLLQNNIDDLKQQQSDIEKAVGYVVSVIDTEIDKLQQQKEALQESNDELDRNIQLQKLKDALETARNNKNTRIYHNDRGWVWESSPDAVKTAEDNINQFQKEEKIRLEQKLLDNQIASWEEYKAQWEDVAKTVELENSKILAQQYLGADIESQILAKRTSAITEYGRKYVETIDAIKQAEIELATLQQQINNMQNLSSTQFTVIGSDGKPTTYDTVQSSAIGSLTSIGSNLVSNIIGSIIGNKMPDASSYVTNKSTNKSINIYPGNIVLPNVTNYEQFVERLATEMTLISNTTE